VLEIVEREAFDFSGCLVLGEGSSGAIRASVFARDGGLASVGSRGFKKAQELNCSDGFELCGCGKVWGNSHLCRLTRQTTHDNILTSSRSPGRSNFIAL